MRKALAVAGPSGGEVSREAQRSFYRIGERLISARLPVTLLVCLLTLFFASRAARLSLTTSLDELLPVNHPYLQVHERYAGEFGGTDDLVIMLEARNGHVFSVERLTRVFLMTQALDRLAGVNHEQIESIAHRTARHVEVGPGGVLRSAPLMAGAPQSEKEAVAIRRLAHKTASVHGRLVSGDDTAVLIRADFADVRLDYRRIFYELDRRVLVPYVHGWIGAQLDMVTEQERAKALVTRMFAGSVAETSGLKKGDLIISVNGVPLVDPTDVAAAVYAARGAGVEIGYERGGKAETLTVTGAAADLEVSVTGAPRLHGWLYYHAGQLIWIFAAAALFAWLALYLYYRDWRGALRPTVTAGLAAVWGLGAMELVGFSLDPLALVVPFFITARALSHSVQMHDRYYEEYLANRFRKRRAILAAYADLFMPTLSAIMTDAAGVLVILLVPVPMLQKLAVTASFWIAAIAVAELIWSPILYDVLRAPDERAVYRRAAGGFGDLIAAAARGVMSRNGRLGTFAFWIALSVLCSTQWSKLTVGDPGSGSPLLYADAPYNQAHRRIQDRFGGVEPLVVIAEGRSRDAMKDPRALAKMEAFQRYLERDPAIASSYSLADLALAANTLHHEDEPKWGVVPDRWVDASGLFFLHFRDANPAESAKYVSPDFRSAPITFFARGHRGEDIRRIVARAEQFIATNPLPNVSFKLAGGMIGVLAAANESLVRNDVLLTMLVYAAVYVVVAFTYRSTLAGLLLLVPLVVSSFVVNAFIGWRGMGINLHILPVIAVGVGFGVDFGLYLLSRTLAAYQSMPSGDLAEPVDERLRASLLVALKTSGRAISFTALTMIAAASLWTFSGIRFDAEMGLLLAVWTAVSWTASLTLLPVLVYFVQPDFVCKASA